MEERRVFLDAACAGDLELRQLLEAKLIAEAEAAAWFGEAVTRDDPGTVAELPGEEPGAFIGPVQTPRANRRRRIRDSVNG